ncbi:MAG: hypothetical protein WA667_28820 [Candidatus Nitrosopolaris sp.]
MILPTKPLEYGYRHEPDVNVTERILLVRRVRVDNQEAASVAELELRSRGWAYTWLKRYNKILYNFIEIKTPFENFFKRLEVLMF